MGFCNENAESLNSLILLFRYSIIPYSVFSGVPIIIIIYYIRLIRKESPVVLPQ